MKERAPARIPDHLPKRLSICSWQWPWITASGPGEPYHDLERVVVGLKERAYNTVRVDAGPDWCFDFDGKPRGEMAFAQVHPGYNSRFRVVNARRGVRCDVLQKVIELVKLADTYDVYVILTCWQYLHSNASVADPELRKAIEDIPRERRLMHLAQQQDRLVRRLKDEGLEKHIAYVEPHNEINYSDFPRGEEGTRLHAEAIAFLRDAHPDLLISADLGIHKPDLVPDNTQVYDIHVYAGANLYHDILWKQTVRHPDFDPKNPRRIPLLDYLLEEHITSYETFVGSEPNIGTGWPPRMWLYYNLDIARFDRWMLERYAEHETEIKAKATRIYDEIAREAARRDLPITLEEGGFFYPPLHSRWEESDAGLGYFGFITELAVQRDFWGFLPTTYNGPECPVWYERPKWLRENNTRFIENPAPVERGNKAIGASASAPAESMNA